jgi:hypothetical protein
MAAPAFPIPKIPNALPCHSFGYHIEVYPIPTAKLVPTIPNKKLKTANMKKLSANGSKNSGIEQSRRRLENTYFPPNLSVKIPMGKRIMDPVKMGIPSSHPTSTILQLKIPLSTKKVTNTPFKVQQAKHTVNANVFRNKILWDWDKEFEFVIILIFF